MLVLGIGDHVSCGSALVENGKNRKRHYPMSVSFERKWPLAFPEQSIKKQIEMHDLSASDIDFVAIGTKNQHLIDELHRLQGWMVRTSTGEI